MVTVITIIVKYPIINLIINLNVFMYDYMFVVAYWTQLASSR